MVKPEIRQATNRDVPAMDRLSAQLGYVSSVADTERRLDVISRSGDHVVLVAISSEREVAGWIHVFQALRIESDAFAEVGGLVVDESLRGQGVGRALLAAAEKWASDGGAGKLRIRSRTARTGAHAFFENSGFVLVKEQQVFDKNLVPVA